MAHVQVELSAMMSAQRWSESSQLYDGDNEVDRDDSKVVKSLIMRLKQNKIHELVEIWESWDQTEKCLFYQEFGDIADLLYFNSNDMTPTVEEYTSLLNIPNIEVDKIYTKIKEKGDNKGIP
ncbi:hypothetical protein V6N13_133683 [Hibiscus sabdariffa]|uniref:Uncharacterized protein n=1 Tax=Hibiscus sabdariffa TaxID=183260 RepID=A0ABR2R0D7_9ROSI